MKTINYKSAMLKTALYLLLGLSFFSNTSCQNEAKKNKVLIIDGQNNHVVWPKATIMLKQYLEETGQYIVDIERTKYLFKSEEYKDWLPIANVGEGVDGEPKTDPDFKPDFSKYDVIVSNFGFKAAPWSKETQEHFETYMKNGGGFVSVHAADNCFPDWEAYNKMIALGGWGGRTEKDGPYLYIDKNNKPKKDYTAGPGGKHGKREPFLVTTYDNTHPITKGFPDSWMHATDECYAFLRGPAENVKILATAVSTLKTPELEQKEPVAMVINYEKGRVFHITLGHQTESLESVGFITLFKRGAEWAATGNVTSKMPNDFPTKQKVRSRPFKLQK